MRKQNTPGNLVLVALLTGLTGIALFVFLETTGGTPLDDGIIIDKPIAEVFQVLVASGNIERLSQNVGNVQVAVTGPLTKGSSYKRILYSHGLPNPQVVIVSDFELNRLWETRTTLVGFDVTYRYELSLAPDGRTLLSLKKDGHGGWPILRPLLIHLLTRPEHDGGHLLRIKQLAESN